MNSYVQLRFFVASEGMNTFGDLLRKLIPAVESSISVEL